MSRRLAFSLVFTICFLVLVGGVSSLVPSATADDDSTASARTTAEEGADKYDKYIIKDFHGKIAVFENGGEAPVKITETLTSSLPQFDTKQLRQGVYAENEREVKRLLEDYCS